MAFPNDDPIVRHGDRTIQLIDLLVGRLEECLGEVLPLETDDLLKPFATGCTRQRGISHRAAGPCTR